MSFFAQSVFLTALASLALAAFAYFKDREKEINRSLALFSLALAIWMFAQGMGAIAAQKEAILLWMRLQVGAAVFLPPFFLYFIFTLLEINQRMKGVLHLSYLTALIFILLDLTPLFVDRIQLFQGIKYYPELTAVYAAFALWLVASFCFGLTLLVMALRKSTGKQYNKLLYVFIASLVGFLGGGTAFFPIFNIKLPVISQLAMPLYVGVATYAIVKHKLLDITVYVRKGMIYSLVTASFTAIYVVLLLAANNFFQGWGQYNSLIATVFTVFGMGLIFQPLRERSQAIIDHLFFKSQYDYQETIKSFSEQLFFRAQVGGIEPFGQGWLIEDPQSQGGGDLFRGSRAHAYRQAGGGRVCSDHPGRKQREEVGQCCFGPEIVRRRLFGGRHTFADHPGQSDGGCF